MSRQVPSGQFVYADPRQLCIGLVTAVNSTRPLKPTVLVYDPAVPCEEAVLVDMEQEAELAVTRALRPQQLPAEAHAYLNPRFRLSYYFDAVPAA